MEMRDSEKMHKEEGEKSEKDRLTNIGLEDNGEEDDRWKKGDERGSLRVKKSQHEVDVNMSYPQLSNSDDFMRVEEPFQYPSLSNSDALRQEFSECLDFSENVDCTFDDAADEIYFDIDEDLEGTTVVPDDEVTVEAPRSGMEFKSVKELLAYYKKYAKQEGFGVRTQRTKRDDDGRPVYVTIGCARGEKYQPKHNNISKPRPTTKTDCKAKVSATLKQNEKWLLTSIENTHNHITVSPKKTRLLRSHKVLDEYSQRILKLNDRAGIRMNKNYYSLVVDARGFENLEFQEKDCRNFIDKSRHLRLGKRGGEALRVYFQKMRQKNDGFVYDIDVDDEGRLRNVFWADARSRAAYECFGDVVTFDTTYLTNQYGMPFAPFVGVNHHGQSILLGAGLLSKKLGSHSHFSIRLKTSIQAALYDSRTCTEFEERWGQLLDKYDLKGNNWLQSLYEERIFWVPAYLKDVFWAGMSMIQRLESMNAFFDGYVHSGTTLKEFIDQFDNALRKR
ncbi:protein FAR1-RELATED SEQUENCE 4-like [Carya illinoinensis]|uniref:protein FAR1-RELATED SEQUENCE 4-like n=1 Tax=Carya illinoinensis TaxID=32201 RepID=UPI001C724303|nr:protein FAR1-RELATED SEQUENCE 4-like [Carya illinoinensis]